MKKIKQSLKNLNLGEDRILNRKELKKIMGGNGYYCLNDADCLEGGTCIDGVCGGDNLGCPDLCQMGMTGCPEGTECYATDPCRRTDGVNVLRNACRPIV